MTFYKYILIGVFNTALGYGLTFYLFWIGVLPELANLLGYIAGFISSYILNKKFNFKSKNKHRIELPKFIVSMMIAYLVNLIVLYISYRAYEINVYISQVIAGVFYVAVGYLLSKKIVFKGV